MQKMLTSVSGAAAPPVMSGPAAAPCSTIVRARSFALKAPGVRCPQLPNPLVASGVQSAFEVHDTARHGAPLHAAPGVPIVHEQRAPVGEPLQVRAKPATPFLQNPQNTFTSCYWSTSVPLIVPNS